MKNLPLILTVLVLLILAGVAFSIQRLNTSSSNPIDLPVPEPQAQACTQEAKICPDGSSVGRTGPNCEFAECPPVITPAPTNPGSDGGGDDMGIGDGSASGSAAGSACVARGGTWDSQFMECVGISAGQCTTIGGTYDPCASACRHDPRMTVCTLQCVEVCEVR